MKLMTFIICFFFFGKAISQRETYSNKTTSDIYICFHFSDKYFFIDHIDEKSIQQNASSDTEYYNPSKKGIIKGEIIINDRKDILCKNSKNGNIYKFRRLNNEMLVNYSIPCLEDTLYIINKNTEDIIIAGRWKDRRKDGTWMFVPKRGFPYYIQYKLGKIVKKTK